MGVLQLGRWSEAVRDYEALRRELPGDNEVAASLHHAQVALKKSRGELVNKTKVIGEVEEVSSIEKFKAAISSPGEVSLDVVLLSLCLLFCSSAYPNSSDQFQVFLLFILKRRPAKSVKKYPHS